MAERRRLRLADELALPDEAVTETFAILGKRGSGKTNTAVVLVEEMVRAKLPVAVVDPVGVWWGLRLAKDGKRAGLDVIILGGEHGDVPLEETAGAVLADFLVESRRPCVFDLSGLRKGAQIRFMTDFAERLYQRKAKAKEPLHLVVDEADAYAPQRALPEGARLLGAMEDLVRRGRSRGIGLTLITQRPQVLNKNVLTQTEVLVVLRLPAPQDRAAIDDWIRANGTPDQQAELLASMASLPRGTAWFWSPAWLQMFQRIEVRARDTFDSSATPKPGDKPVAPAELAPVDLAELEKRIAATIQKAKAEDPKALRARVAALEAELARRPAPPPERVEVPVLTAKDREGLAAFTTMLEGTVREVGRFLAELAPKVARVDHVPKVSRVVVDGVPARSPRAPRPAAPAPRTGVANGLQKRERAVLQVLVQHGRSTRQQVAILSGYAFLSSSLDKALASLRAAAFITGPGDALEATPAGVHQAGAVAPLPRGRALLDFWLARLEKRDRAVLSAVHDVYPRGLSREALEGVTGYSASSSSMDKALAKLRALELITRDSEPCASDVFFDGRS